MKKMRTRCEDVHKLGAPNWWFIVEIPLQSMIGATPISWCYPYFRETPHVIRRHNLAKLHNVWHEKHGVSRIFWQKRRGHASKLSKHSSSFGCEGGISWSSSPVACEDAGEGSGGSLAPLGWSSFGSLVGDSWWVQSIRPLGHVRQFMWWLGLLGLMVDCYDVCSYSVME